MQPQAVALINGTWVISQNIANELCFRYEFDGRRRMIIEKVPGAGQVWEVYDARNRPVMTKIPHSGQVTNGCLSNMTLKTDQIQLDL